MTMIERVARALAFASLDPQTRVAVDMDKHFPFVRDFYMEQARAAIQAMREPTKEMVEAGYSAMHDAVDFYSYDSGSGYSIELAGGADVLRAMIDAALSETSEES